jgi:hypothetical protein
VSNEGTKDANRLRRFLLEAQVANRGLLSATSHLKTERGPCRLRRLLLEAQVPNRGLFSATSYLKAERGSCRLRRLLLDWFSEICSTKRTLFAIIGS